MTTRMTSPPTSTPRDDIILLVVTAVTLGLVFWLVAPALEVPAQVDRITIENQHPWPAHLEVNEPGDDGWLGIGTVDQDDDKTVQSVSDHGDRWVFRFSYAGQRSELHVTRAQLERDDWHVTVPDDFARRLRDAGQPHAPSW